MLQAPHESNKTTFFPLPFLLTTSLLLSNPPLILSPIDSAHPLRCLPITSSSKSRFGWRRSSSHQEMWDSSPFPSICCLFSRDPVCDRKPMRVWLVIRCKDTILWFYLQSFFSAMSKIVGTLGPQSESVETISRLLKAGMSGDCF